MPIIKQGNHQVPFMYRWAIQIKDSKVVYYSYGKDKAEALGRGFLKDVEIGNFESVEPAGYIRHDGELIIPVEFSAVLIADEAPARETRK